MREVAAQFERPVLLFSGGKDSIVLVRLAQKAFWPGTLPVPAAAHRHRPQLPRDLEFRDWLGARRPAPSCSFATCRTRSTAAGASRRRARTPAATCSRPSRCSTRCKELKVDAAFGGARRDEEKARAKERFFSHRDRVRPVGSRRTSGPSCGTCSTAARTRASTSASSRCATGPRWTSGSTSRRSSSRCRTLYFAHRARRLRPRRRAAGRDAVHHAAARRRRRSRATVRFRTVGDATCTGAVESDAVDARGNHREVAAARVTERGSRVRRPALRSRDGRPQAAGVLLMATVLRFRLTPATVRSPMATGAQSVSRDGPAALHHGGQRRRRQEHADRPAALRHEVDLRGPARGDRERQQRRGEEYVNLALLTDGLRAEREQNITIDVAYRYFATPQAQVHHRRHARATSSTRATW